MINNVLQEIRGALAMAWNALDWYTEKSGHEACVSVGKAIKKLDAYIADNGWLPIDCAPKDGTLILICFKSELLSVWWQQTTFWSNEECWEGLPKDIIPTHFQYLPLPPTGNTNKGK